MSQPTRLDEDHDAALRATYKRIKTDIAREKRDFQSMLFCCIVLGLCGMGGIALCTHVTSISPAGFCVGAVFIAGVAFMMLAG